MKSWLKYALSFFALCLILTGFIYVFGPGNSRQAVRDGESTVGQLPANAELTSPAQQSGDSK